MWALWKQTQIGTNVANLFLFTSTDPWVNLSYHTRWLTFPSLPWNHDIIRIHLPLVWIIYFLLYTMSVIRSHGSYVRIKVPCLIESCFLKTVCMCVHACVCIHVSGYACDFYFVWLLCDNKFSWIITCCLEEHMQVLRLLSWALLVKDFYIINIHKCLLGWKL